jgi:hypothetical protein
MEWLLILRSQPLKAEVAQNPKPCFVVIHTMHSHLYHQELVIEKTSPRSFELSIVVQLLKELNEPRREHGKP